MSLVSKCKYCFSVNIYRKGIKVRTIYTLHGLQTEEYDLYMCKDCGKNMRLDSSIIGPYKGKYGWDIIEFVLNRYRIGDSLEIIRRRLKDMDINISLSTLSHWCYEYGEEIDYKS